MADISKCNGNNCSKTNSCYRFTAKPNQYLQSYAAFQPDSNGYCDGFWDNKDWIDIAE